MTAGKWKVVFFCSNFLNLFRFFPHFFFVSKFFAKLLANSMGAQTGKSRVILCWGTDSNFWVTPKTSPNKKTPGKNTKPWVRSQIAPQMAIFVVAAEISQRNLREFSIPSPFYRIRITANPGFGISKPV